MDIQQYLNSIRVEERRNADFLHMTAYENQMSKTARSFMGSKIDERYYMGGGTDGVMDFGDFTAMGFKGVEDLVSVAKDAAKQMLFAADVNLNVLSGVHAMMSSILATTEPGDTVMTVPLEWGGHFATKGILDRVGRKHLFADYDYGNLRFDAEKIGAQFQQHHVKALYLDVSYYLNPHNLREIREAVGPDAIIIYDASHTMGLIMGQQFQAPLKEGADIICANTHKTLPGPHKGMIAFRDLSMAKKANAIIDGSLYSTTHMTHIIALSIAILEMKEFGKEYATQIIANSNAIAEAFDRLGYTVRRANTGRYSENHQAHVFIDTKGDRIALYRNLLRNSIDTNFQSSELTVGHKTFMRIGTAEVTHLGMKEPQMATIAGLMDRALAGTDVRTEVAALNHAFPDIHYSFDAR